VAESCVTDTGPPLHLAEIAQIRLLTVFERISLSGQVKSELVQHDVFDRITSALGDRLAVEQVGRPDIKAQRIHFADLHVQTADLSVAVLAVRNKSQVVLTDDLDLRKGLENLGLTVVGSIGVCVRAFSDGLLTRQETCESLDRLLNDSSLYLSRAFRDHVQNLLDNLSP